MGQFLLRVQYYILFYIKIIKFVKKINLVFTRIQTYAPRAEQSPLYPQDHHQTFTTNGREVSSAQKYELENKYK